MRQRVEMKSSSIKLAERGKWWPSSMEARSHPMAVCSYLNRTKATMSSG
jgi:hypothetical protein